MTLHQVRIFRTVVRCRGVAAASRELNLAPSAVSLHLKELGRELGAPLFEIIGRRLKLTPLGQAFLPYSERLLADARDALAAMRDLAGWGQRALLIGASSTPGLYLLPPILGEMSRSHPELSFSLVFGNTRQIEAQVVSGDLDLGFVGGRLAERGVEAERLLEDEIRAVFPAGHPLAKKRRLLWEDVQSTPHLTREQGSATRHAAEEALKARGWPPPRTSLELASPEGIKKLVAAGLGFSFLSTLSVREEERTGLLASRRIEGLLITRPLLVIWRARRPRNRAVETFLDVARTHVK